MYFEHFQCRKLLFPLSFSGGFLQSFCSLFVNFVWTKTSLCAAEESITKPFDFVLTTVHFSELANCLAGGFASFKIAFFVFFLFPRIYVYFCDWIILIHSQLLAHCLNVSGSACHFWVISYVWYLFVIIFINVRGIFITLETYLFFTKVW